MVQLFLIFLGAGGVRRPGPAWRTPDGGSAPSPPKRLYEVPAFPLLARQRDSPTPCSWTRAQTGRHPPQNPGGPACCHSPTNHHRDIQKLLILGRLHLTTRASVWCAWGPVPCVWL